MLVDDAGGLSLGRAALTDFASRNSLQAPVWRGDNQLAFVRDVEDWFSAQRPDDPKAFALSILGSVVPAIFQGGMPGTEYLPADSARLRDRATTLPFWTHRFDGQSRVILPFENAGTNIALMDIIETIDGRAFSTIDEAGGCTIDGLRAGNVMVTGRRAVTDEPFSEMIEVCTSAQCPRFGISTRSGATVVTIGNLGEPEAVADLFDHLAAMPPSQIEQGIVLDLRWSTGGLLNEILTLMDAFVHRGPLFSTASVATCPSAAYDIERYFAFPAAGSASVSAVRNLLEEAPLTIVVGPQTSRGATLIAASLQELDRATIVGEPVQGDGLVHTVIPLADLQAGALIVPNSQLATPSGREVSSIRIVPDVAAQVTDVDRFVAVDVAISTFGNR